MNCCNEFGKCTGGINCPVRQNCIKLDDGDDFGQPDFSVRYVLAYAGIVVLAIAGALAFVFNMG